MYQLPAVHAEAVTPHDTNENKFAYLLVEQLGDVTIEPASGGANVTFTSVPAFTYLWVRTNKVLDTGTDAISIIGFR